MPEIGLLGSEGGATSSVVPTPIMTPRRSYASVTARNVQTPRSFGAQQTAPPRPQPVNQQLRHPQLHRVPMVQRRMGWNAEIGTSGLSLQSRFDQMFPGPTGIVVARSHKEKNAELGTGRMSGVVAVTEVTSDLRQVLFFKLFASHINFPWVWTEAASERSAAHRYHGCGGPEQESRSIPDAR